MYQILVDDQVALPHKNHTLFIFRLFIFDIFIERGNLHSGMQQRKLDSVGIYHWKP